MELDSRLSPTTPSLSNAAAWSLGTKFADQLVGIVSISILARLLSPDDFGIVAMASAFVALIEVFASFGFDWALVKTQAPSRQHYDTAWTLKLLLATGTCIVLSLAAIPASNALNAPAVAPLMVAMGLNGLLGGLENIGVVDFRRTLRFDRDFRYRMAGRMAGLIAAVSTAWLTGSYWALVVGVTASRMVTVLSSYLMHPFRPRWSLAKRSDLLQFSIWLMAGNVVELARQKFADLWLGRRFGPGSVGFYSMAAQLSAIASTELAAPINRAVFTRYAQMSSEATSLRESFLRVSGLIWVIGVPAAIGTGVCADLIVAVLLGDKWTDTSRVLQILALSGLFGVMAGNTHYVYWALGRSRFVTMLSAVGLTIFVTLAIVLGSSYGLLGVAVAQVTASGVTLLLNYSALIKTLSTSLSEIVTRIFRIPLAGAVMALVVYGSTTFLWSHVTGAPVLRLLLAVLTGVVTYFSALWTIWSILGRPDGPERDALLLARNWLQGANRWRARSQT